MALFKRMTNKKREILETLKHDHTFEVDKSPYNAHIIAYLIQSCGTVTNSNERSMRRTLNTMVDEGLLYKVKMLDIVTMNYKGGQVDIEKMMWRYDLIENKSTVEDIKVNHFLQDKAKAEKLEADAAEYGLDVGDYLTARGFGKLPPKTIIELLIN